MANDTAPNDPVPEKLRLFRSPLVREDDGQPEVIVSSRPKLNPAEVRHMGYRSELEDEPKLIRHDNATNLEVFYDLFLACLSLFNQNQVVATLPGLSAYIGFFGLLWTTWLITGLYDVRFVTDSIFERLARAIHFGVLVGFVVTSPNFDPNDQEPEVFQTFSIILMVSRLCLACEYACIIFHVRRYKAAKLQFVLMVILNVVVALIYLGVSFRFERGSSQVFYVWYGLAAIEVIFTVGLSVHYPLLGFQGTHLIRRMSLLTLIIFGEGIAVAANGITEVVKIGHSEWTPGTIGVVTACAATIYVVFMIYFDWMRHLHLPGWRQLTWSLLHFPLHLTLTLFLEGCGHFIVFYKVAESEEELLRDWFEIIEETEPDSWASALQNWTEGFQDRFQPAYGYQSHVINDTFRDMRALDLSVLEDPDTSEDERMQDDNVRRLLGQLETLLFTLDNMAYAALGVDFLEDQVEDQMGIDGVDEHEIDMDTLAANLNVRTYRRFRVVFKYTFICGCGVLVLANALYCIARIEKWHPWAVARAVANCFVAVAVGLVAVVAIDEEHLWDYRNTPWVVPTILIPFLVVLALNHLPKAPPVWGFPAFSWMSWRGKRRSGDKDDNDPEAVYRNGSVESDSPPNEMITARPPQQKQQPQHRVTTPESPQSYNEMNATTGHGLQGLHAHGGPELASFSHPDNYRLRATRTY